MKSPSANSFVLLALALSTFITCLAQDPGEKDSSPTPSLPDGRFGKGFDGHSLSVVPSKAEESHRVPPLTVECWAKLDSPVDWNVIAGCDPKGSMRHWEIYTQSGTGEFSAYLSGCEPDIIKSDRVITDGEWHYLAMVYEPERVRLYVDGMLVQDQPLTSRGAGEYPPPGPLQVGGLVTDRFVCNGIVDELRISQGVRAIGNPPEAPFATDDQTVGLWNFDEIKNGAFEDSSAIGQALGVEAKQAGTSGQ